MQSIFLSACEAAVKNANVLIVIEPKDLTELATDTTQKIRLFTAGAGRVVKFVSHELDPAFKDSADNTFNTTTGIIGDSGDTDRHMVSTEFNENGTEILRSLSNLDSYRYAAATDVDLILSAMADKALASINTGRLFLYFNVV